MPQILASGHRLPIQISMELHFKTQMAGLNWGGWGPSLGPGEIAAFGTMMNRAGYYLTDRHDNPFCYSCSEIVYAWLEDGGVSGGGGEKDPLVAAAAKAHGGADAVALAATKYSSWLYEMPQLLIKFKVTATSGETDHW